MSSATAVLPSNEADFKIELFTRRQRYLDALGLTKLAERLAACEHWWTWYKSGEDWDDLWRKQNYTSMMRSDPYMGKRLAVFHEEKYRAFGEMIQGTGTRIDFRFHTVKTRRGDLAHREHQSLIRKIRTAIKTLLPPAINKIGAYDDAAGRYNRVVKALVAGAVTAPEFVALQLALPAGVSCIRRYFFKEDALQAIREWAAADLPLDEIERADFELLIHGLHLTQYTGVPRAVVQKFALRSKTPNANSRFEGDSDALLAATVAKRQGKIKVPRSPKTGKLARFVSSTVDWMTRAYEMREQLWMALPDTP